MLTADAIVGLSALWACAAPATDTLAAKETLGEAVGRPWRGLEGEMEAE
jgi:hypothetical protein